MAAGRALTIDIKTTDAQTLAALKRIQKELKDTGTTAQHTSKQGLSLGSALGGLAIGAGLKTAVGEFEEAEVTARKTAAAIEATGNAAGVSAREQEKLVTSLSKMAGVDDEVVAGGANMLRTFTAIKGEKFGETLAASMDVAAAKNIELSQASQMLGKALQDPFTGYVKLQKTMGPFSESAKAQIAAFQKVNDVAGAQGVILDELKGRFGGQAEAAATDSAKMKVAFGDAAESLGASLAPAMTAAATGAEKLSGLFQGLPQPVQQGALALGAVAFVAPKVASGMESIRAATTDAEGATTRMGKALGAAGVAAGAATGIYALNEYRKATTGLKVDIEGLLGATDEEIARSLQQVAQFADQGDFEKVGRSNIDALYAMRDALKANGDDALPALNDAIKVVEAEQARAAARTKQYADANAAAVGPTEDLAAAIGTVNDVLVDAHSRGVEANQAYAGYLQSTLDVNQAVVDVADAQSTLADADAEVADSRKAIADSNQAVADARRGVADAEASVEQARRGVDAATRSLAEAEKAAAASAEDIITATEDLAQAQADALIGSDYMADSLQGVADAEAALALSQADSLAAQEALTAARDNYGQTLRDLSDDAAGAADDVTLAEIAIRDAMKRAAEVAADPKATADDRERAAIAIREAERRLHDAQERAAEAKAELERNQANGAEGSDAVVAAQDAVTAAAGRQESAQATLEGAVQTVADTQVEANGRVEVAQATLAEKIDARAAADQRVVDARQGVVDANGAVQKAVEGVDTANRNVASAIDGVIAAQGRYAEAKEAAKTAQGEVATAVQGVKDKLDIQATAWAGLVTTFKFDGPLRKAVRDVTGELGQLAGDYDVNVNLGGNAANAILTGVSNPFLDALAAALGPDTNGDGDPGKSAMGDKSGPGSGTGAAWDKGAPPSSPGTTPAARSDGWVQQPNGRWYHPRMPGEANYGDGYSDYGPTPHPGKPGSNVPGLPTPGAKSIEINVYGVNDPAATAEMIYRRAGWELTHLNGAA